MRTYNNTFFLPACAWVKSQLLETVDHPLFHKNLYEMKEEEYSTLLRLGEKHNIRLHHFAKTEEYEYINKLLGYLRGIVPDELLDIGCGRSSFIWRLIHEFPTLGIMAIDHQEYYITRLKSIQKAGIPNLKARNLDVYDMQELRNHQYDITTFINTLQFLDFPEKAIQQASLITKRFIIAVVPENATNHPEQKHDFSEDKLKAMFLSNGIIQVKIEHTANYRLIIGRK